MRRTTSCESDVARGRFDVSPVTPKMYVPSEASPPEPQMPERGLCVAQPAIFVGSAVFTATIPAEVRPAVAVLAAERDVEDAVEEQGRAGLVRAPELKVLLLYVSVVLERVTGQPPVVVSVPSSTERAWTRCGLFPVTTKRRRVVASTTGVPRMPLPPVVTFAVHTGRPVASSNAKTLGLNSRAAKAKKRPAPALRAVDLQPVAAAGHPAAAGPSSR